MTNDRTKRALQKLKDLGATVVYQPATGRPTDPVFDLIRETAREMGMMEEPGVRGGMVFPIYAKGATPMVSTAERTDTRQLVTGGDPDALFTVPNVIEPGEEFGDGYAIEQIAIALIDSDEHGLSHLRDASIGYLWKAKGGKAKGQPTLGKCVKPSGLLTFFTDHEFVIWCAADNVAAAALTNWQVEAVLYHELSHIAVKPTDDDDTEEELAIVGHDVEEFQAVIDRYGDWRPALTRMKETFQARMAL